MKMVNDFLLSILNDGDTIVLGCSGGPDSMALFVILLKVEKKIDISIICAHVNHKVRKESDDELVFLKEFCKNNHIVFESMVIDNYGDDNFHNEARNIRYNFFEKLVKKYNAKYLMTAHHGDDLRETVLMRIVRGSTLHGYSGFDQVVNKDFYSIVRPLVFVTKDEIINYDNDNDIEYVVDKSNFSTKYTRNRYRKDVLPFLKKEDKNVHLKFLKYSKMLNEYNNYIDNQADKYFENVCSNGMYIDIEKFNCLDSVIKNRIINKMLEDYYSDDLILISDIHTNLIMKMIGSKRSNSCIYLPNGIKAIKSYNKFYLDVETDQIDEYEIEISDYVNLPNGKNIELVEEGLGNNNYCRLCSEDIVLPLRVRTRKLGDKMKVKGLNGTKKVKDIFINEKIPINKRDLWPIVVDASDTIVWIPGLKKSKFDIPKDKKCDIILKYY